MFVLQKTRLEYTDDGTPVVELVWSGDVDDPLYIILPGIIPVRRVGAQPARDLRCCPMGDTSSRRLGIDILDKGNISEDRMDCRKSTDRTYI